MYYKTRKLRGMQQRMFLLDVCHNVTHEESVDEEWIFQVKGTTSDYDVLISMQNFSCSCPDYKTRGKICKHLYFIIGRIAECNTLINSLESEIEAGTRGSYLTEGEFDTITKSLIKRLSTRLNQVETTTTKSNDIDIPDLSGESCVICFEDLSDGNVAQCVNVGPHCKNYFHKNCLDEWLYKNQSCPLCRRKWNLKPNDIKDDPLDKLNCKNIKL